MGRNEAHVTTQMKNFVKLLFYEMNTGSLTFFCTPEIQEIEIVHNCYSQVKQSHYYFKPIKNYEALLFYIERQCEVKRRPSSQL